MTSSSWSLHPPVTLSAKIPGVSLRPITELSRPDPKPLAVGGKAEPRIRAAAGLKPVLLAGLVTLVPGCVHYQDRPLAPAETAARYEARSLASPELQDFLIAQHVLSDRTAWPRSEWDFETLTWVAFRNHPSLELARAQWEVATAGLKTAAGRPNPTVGLTPGYNFNPARGVSPWFPGWSVDLPIETAGKRGKRMTRAGHLAESARQNVETAAWQVRGRLRAALLDAVTSSRRREQLQAQFQLQQESVRLLEQRQQAGAVSSVEVTTARLALLRIRTATSDATRLETEARSAVAEALGLPLAALKEVRLRFPEPAGAPQPPLEQARALALQRRSDLRSLLAAYEASQAALQVEIARQYPDLHLGTGYQWDQGENKWNLALNVEVPLLNRNQGPIAEAEARRREAAAQFTTLQARVIADIDRAASILATTEDHLVQLRQADEAVGGNLEQVRRRVEAGGGDRLELQAAHLERAASTLTLLEATARASLAAGQLEDALQAPIQALSLFLFQPDPNPQTAKDTR